MDGLNLSKDEKEIAVALQGTQIKYLSEEEFGLAMDALVHNTFLSCGIKYEEEVVDKTIDEFIGDTRKYFSTITVDEIKIAFSKGWKGEYGEFFGLNNKTYHQWLCGYMYGVKRANTKKAIQESNENRNKKPELTENEKEAILREGAITKFNEFKTTGNFYDFGNITYNYLDRLGLIKFTVDVKKLIMNECRIRLLEEEKMKKTQQQYIGKHQAINDEIKKLEEGKSTRLISESKREALKQYFIQLIEMDEELKNII